MFLRTFDFFVKFLVSKNLKFLSIYNGNKAKSICTAIRLSSDVSLGLLACTSICFSKHLDYIFEVTFFRIFFFLTKTELALSAKF